MDNMDTVEVEAVAVVGDEDGCSATLMSVTTTTTWNSSDHGREKNLVVTD